jgi:hypothetical protein
MDEQRLERELRAGLADWLDPAIGEHPRWATSPAAGRVAGIPSRRAFSGRWGLLWAAALLALLLVALLAATVFVGARRPDHAVVIAPSASPAATGIAGEATVLATTKAKPLPTQATCPPGSNPDAPGPADQERPHGVDAGMAFDRHAGRMVLFAEDDYKIVQRDPFVWGSRTWTYDVCTNTWQRMGPLDTLDGAPDWLVYDADSDRTVAFTDTGQFWSYDLEADRWTKAGWFPEIRRGWGEGSWRTGAVYHDPSGLIIIYDGATMWAYDVEGGTLTEIPQRPDPSRPPGAGTPPHTRAAGIESAHYDPSGGDFIGYDPRINRLVVLVRPARPGGPSTPRPADETWTFDPGSGTWRAEAWASTPAVGYLGASGGPAAYDEVSGLTLFPDDAKLRAYDAPQRTWRSEPFWAGSSELAVSWCARSFDSSVYDPLNRRIVCLGGAVYRGDGPEDTSGVSALSTATGQWRWLLEPLPVASPSP